LPFLLPDKRRQLTGKKAGAAIFMWLLLSFVFPFAVILQLSFLDDYCARHTKNAFFTVF
jgi:hypothetical protein